MVLRVKNKTLPDHTTSRARGVEQSIYKNLNIINILANMPFNLFSLIFIRKRLIKGNHFLISISLQPDVVDLWYFKL